MTAAEFVAVAFTRVAASQSRAHTSLLPGRHLGDRPLPSVCVPHRLLPWDAEPACHAIQGRSHKELDRRHEAGKLRGQATGLGYRAIGRGVLV